MSPKKDEPKIKEPVHTLPGTRVGYDRAAERVAAQTDVAGLDEFDAAIIRFLISQGFMQKRIASLFDCAQSVINEIDCDQKLPGNKLIHSVYQLTKA